MQPARQDRAGSVQLAPRNLPYVERRMACFAPERELGCLVAEVGVEPTSDGLMRTTGSPDLPAENVLGPQGRT